MRLDLTLPVSSDVVYHILDTWYKCELTNVGQLPTMNVLRYVGTVVNGRGGHSALGVPGRAALENAPDEWPDVLQPGSLNVLIADDGYPSQHREFGQAITVKALDSGSLPPAFIIPQRAFRNNQLVPTDANPNRGTGQVWRAELTANGHLIHCWVLRRIGSGLSREIELISVEAIRETYGLTTDKDWPAEVLIHSGQRTVLNGLGYFCFWPLCVFRRCASFAVVLFVPLEWPVLMGTDIQGAT